MAFYRRNLNRSLQKGARGILNALGNKCNHVSMHGEVWLLCPFLQSPLGTLFPQKKNVKLSARQAPFFVSKAQCQGWKIPGPTKLDWIYSLWLHEERWAMCRTVCKCHFLDHNYRRKAVAFFHLVAEPKLLLWQLEVKLGACIKQKRSHTSLKEDSCFVKSHCSRLVQCKRSNSHHLASKNCFKIGSTF